MSGKRSRILAANRLEWLKKYGDFDNGIPADNTIARVVSSIDSVAFEKVFIEWMQVCHEITDGEIIAIDGKTIRGSYDKGKRKGAIHMVSILDRKWCCAGAGENRSQK